MALLKKTFLQGMDDWLRWTGMPQRVALELAQNAAGQGKHRPMRWLPLLPVIIGIGMMITACWVRSPWTVLGMGGLIGGLIAPIKQQGPLGKPALEDDEREAAVRKSAYLFCFGALAILNVVGHPILAAICFSRNLAAERIMAIEFASFFLNLALVGSLPTLYASWASGRQEKST